MNAKTLYCLCRKPYESDQFMIECDVCNDWFHGTCVNLKEDSAEDIEFYHCPRCQISHGPLILKKRRHMQTCSDASETKTGSLKFLAELKQRTFPSAENIPMRRLDSISAEDLDQLDTPILVPSRIPLKLPPSSFSIADVASLVGVDREVDVIDVAQQENTRMRMWQWVNYFNQPAPRHPIYNVISLEFSNTKLADIVSPPAEVHQVSWMDKYWPQHCPHAPPRPTIQRYCLMGTQGSFTDFHIDFGGTSVWYHIFKGEKIFYLIRPTSSNLVLYERWLSSSNQSQTFFADQVDTCYILSVKQGQTIMLPSGWIHAVFTPVDCLVFGGNFLLDHSIPMQLKVYEIERRVGTQARFMYPCFETIHWYAAHHFNSQLARLSERGEELGQGLGVALKALLSALKSWTSHRDTSNTHEVPPFCRCLSGTPSSLIRDLHKKLKITAPFLNKTSTKGQPKTARVDRYRVNYRHTSWQLGDDPTRTSIRSRPSDANSNFDMSYGDKYEDDDDDGDDGALMVDERTRMQRQQQHQQPQQQHQQQHHQQQHHQQQQYHKSAIKSESIRLKLPYDTPSNFLHTASREPDNTSQGNMRDAIHGMLTMSQMHPSSTPFQQHDTHLNNDNNEVSSRRRFYSDDIEQELNSCYKDDNFVYPSVASSESDDGGKVQKRIGLDEAWHPKARRRGSASRTSRSSRTKVNCKGRQKGAKQPIKNYEDDLPMEDMKYPQCNHLNNNTFIEDNNCIKTESCANDSSDVMQTDKQKSYNERLVDTIHYMHNYSSYSYYDNEKSVDDKSASFSDGEEDDVDLNPKKKPLVFTPLKAPRTRKTPTTAKQRLAQKLKLNKDCF